MEPTHRPRVRRQSSQPVGIALRPWPMARSENEACLGLGRLRLGLLASILVLAFHQPALAGASNSARGVVKALDRADIATQLTAPVSFIGFLEGQEFKSGDRLLAFDCAQQHAQLSAAKAKVQEAELNLKSNLYLSTHRAIGRHDVAIAGVRLEHARAEASAIEAQISKCEVRAPFDGVVTKLSINRFEYPKTGEPYLQIISLKALEIELIVPSIWLRWLTKDHLVSFGVDELKRSVRARLVRIGGAVDPVSQTVKVYARPLNPPSALRPGMSGTADFGTAAAKPRVAQRSQPEASE